MSVGVSRVTSKGQVTIPREIRVAKGIREGTPLVFVDVPAGILVQKSEDVSEFFRVFQDRAKELGLTREQLDQEVEELKKERVKKYKV